MMQLIFLAIVSLSLASPIIQTPATEPASPGWFIVFEEKFAPSGRALFMKAQRESIDLWKMHFPEVPVFAWQNDDNTMYRIIPILSFASIDTLYRKVEQVSEIVKAGKVTSEERPGNQSTVSGTVMMWIPELSHNQSIKFSPYPDKPYSEWMFAYLHSGLEKEAGEALRRFRDYYIDNRLDYPWDTFRVLLGNDTPVMIGLFRAESQAALQLKGKQIWEKHGDELGKLWDDVVRYTWKIESKTGWFNPSLSNLPLVVPAEDVARGLP
jgi:hypothetical protein